jgi:hypothetical protein
MEGAAVLFPQSAPYTDPVTMLVCGGSNFGIALDNCVSMQPESNNPTWVIERMVRPVHLVPYLRMELTHCRIALSACHALHGRTS